MWLQVASIDGSGVTPAMEAARLIMAAAGKPKRTIIVALWAAENSACGLEKLVAETG
jgi:hypothetical protein